MIAVLFAEIEEVVSCARLVHIVCKNLIKSESSSVVRVRQSGKEEFCTPISREKMQEILIHSPPNFPYCRKDLCFFLVKKLCDSKRCKTVGARTVKILQTMELAEQLGALLALPAASVDILIKLCRGGKPMPPAIEDIVAYFYTDPEMHKTLAILAESHAANNASGGSVNGPAGANGAPPGNNKGAGGASSGAPSKPAGTNGAPPAGSGNGAPASSGAPAPKARSVPPKRVLKPAPKLVLEPKPNPKASTPRMPSPKNSKKGPTKVESKKVQAAANVSKQETKKKE